MLQILFEACMCITFSQLIRVKLSEYSMISFLSSSYGLGEQFILGDL